MVSQLSTPHTRPSSYVLGRRDRPWGRDAFIMSDMDNLRRGRLNSTRWVDGVRREAEWMDVLRLSYLHYHDLANQICRPADQSERWRPTIASSPPSPGQKSAAIILMSARRVAQFGYLVNTVGPALRIATSLRCAAPVRRYSR